MGCGLRAAARNASNLGDLADAAERYKELSKYGMLTDAARIEYAGVLYRVGQADEAALLLEQGSPSVQDLRLLASIYASGKHFSKAIAIYDHLLKIQPDDPAGTARTGRQFVLVARVWKGLESLSRDVESHPTNDELRERLAETLLFDKQYQAAVQETATLLDHHPERQDLWNTFLMAAAGSPSLGVGRPGNARADLSAARSPE